MAGELGVGRRLGRYEIVEVIASGGMGEVYRAQDTQLPREVAVKTLRRGPDESEVLRRRFEREARIAARLSHPHICRLYDFGREDGLDYLVMELVAGETLRERLRRGPLGLDETLRLGCQLASALAEAHIHGVIHRDVKPGNVMLTGRQERPDALLLDFGIAKRQAADSQATLSLSDDDLTRDGEMVGTAAYMSPEQLRGGVVDERSDLFSFGAVLYEMLAGRPAFASSGWSGFVARVLGRPADLDELDAKVAPVALKRVLQRCLQVDPVQRWPSASDLLRELEACRDGGSGRPAPAAAPTAAPATPRPARPSAAEDSTAADSGAISAPGAVVRLVQAGLVAVAFLLSGLTLYVINPSVHDAFLYPLLALSGALPIAMAMAAIWDVDLRTGASGLIRGLGSFLGGAASPPDRGWRRAIGIAVLIYLATTVGYVGGHVADAVLPRLTLLQLPRKPAADWSIENPDEDWKTYRAAYKAAFLSTFAASESDFQTHKYELGRGSVRGARTMLVFATILVAAGVVDLVRGRRRRGALALASGMVACLLLYSLWYEGESGYVQDMVSASARLPAPSRPAVPASAPEILRRLEPAGSVR